MGGWGCSLLGVWGQIMELKLDSWWRLMGAGHRGELLSPRGTWRGPVMAWGPRHRELVGLGPFLSHSVRDRTVLWHQGCREGPEGEEDGPCAWVWGSSPVLLRRASAPVCQNRWWLRPPLRPEFASHSQTCWSQDARAFYHGFLPCW